MFTLIVSFIFITNNNYNNNSINNNILIIIIIISIYTKPILNDRVSTSLSYLDNA